jgi:tetratricopeptide (TPR) repeat protein
MSTGLTPSLSRISIAQADVSTLISLAKTMLESNCGASALYYCERLFKLTREIGHGVLLARCHYLANEKRRCLGVIEQLGYLGDNAMQCIRDGSNQADHYLSALLLSAQCLLDLEQYEDCISLIDPLVGSDKFRVGSPAPLVSSGAHTLATTYYVLGRCYDALDNRPRAVRYLIKAILTDPNVIEVVEYMMCRCLLSTKEKLELLREVSRSLDQGASWLIEHYTFLLNDNIDDIQAVDCTPNRDVGVVESRTMILQAERLYDQFRCEESCRMARRAYALDPYNWRGLAIYIACLCDMEYKTELFYLGIYIYIVNHISLPLILIMIYRS